MQLLSPTSISLYLHCNLEWNGLLNTLWDRGFSFEWVLCLLPWNCAWRTVSFKDTSSLLHPNHMRNIYCILKARLSPMDILLCERGRYSIYKKFYMEQCHWLLWHLLAKKKLNCKNTYTVVPLIVCLFIWFSPVNCFIQDGWCAS